MNSLKNMQTTDHNLTFTPVNAVKAPRLVPLPVPLPVHFAADFPIEFTIQPLEDVPLRAEPSRRKALPAAGQKP